MVVRVVKLSLIHKIAVLPRGGQEWFLARGLLSRLETRRKLISFLPVIGIHELYEPTECQRGEKASLASYSSIVVPCSGFYSSTVIDYDLLENISVSYGFSSIEEDKRKGGIRVETVIELEPYL